MQQVLVNTSNTYFLQKIVNILEPGIINKFEFTFNTNGFYEHEDILIDLLPHGLDMVIELFGFFSIKNLQKTINKNSVKVIFNYNNKLVIFNFSQGSSIQKLMKIRLNDNVFRRIQVGTADTYKVLFENIDTKVTIQAKDPFDIYCQKFLLGHENLDRGLHGIHLMNLIMNLHN